MDSFPFTLVPNDSSSSSNSSFSLCPSAATRLLLPLLYLLLFLTALPGNSVSLWVFCRRISSVSPVHVYLSHLSVSNLLLSLTAPFLAAYYAWGSAWALGGAPCQLVLHAITPLLHMNVYISLLILTLVALCRFASLIRHTHASRPSACTRLLPSAFFSCFTRATFARRVCVLVWAMAVAGIVPVTVQYSVNEAMKGHAVEEEEEEEGGCKEVCSNPEVEIGGSTSASITVGVIVLFFFFYLLVVLSYMMVVRHIRRSRRSTNVSSSQSLLGRVQRNILIIQVVLSVCLLPYHIFKPIFISLAHYHVQPWSGPDLCDSCHPLSRIVELKNVLFFLATARGSTDPLMFFLLDKTFHRQILRLLGRGRNGSNAATGKTTFSSETGSATQKATQQGEGNVTVTMAECSQGNVL